MRPQLSKEQKAHECDATMMSKEQMPVTKNKKPKVKSKKIAGRDFNFLLFNFYLNNNHAKS
ncbi:MAG TPA: hypothetical protein VHZ50_11730 [Puia sp.]|nr:hypothetical protein [Puia sp.]